MSGTDAIANRSNQLIGEATDEVVLVLGDESLLTEELIDSLTELRPEVALLIGAVTETLEAKIHDAVPNATTFVSGLGWLRNGAGTEDLAIGRLLLVDRSTILVSTLVPDTGEEQAIFGGGFRNGLVVISRRLLAQGLLPQRDSHPE